MKFKKFFAVALSAAMVFGGMTGLAQAPKAVVFAEEKPTVAIDVKYGDEFAIEISSPEAGNDNFFILEVMKDDKDDAKVSATYVYEAQENEGKAEISIDPSFLKIGAKELYIRAYGDVNKTPCKTVKIAAQTGKVALKYVAGKATVAESFLDGKEKITEETIGQYQVRHLYGSAWTALKDIDLKMLSVAGATLLVRKNTIEKTAVVAPMSAEGKVKIAAAPKAPKVTLDYAKNVIKLPKGAEVRIFGKDVKDAPFYMPVAEKGESLTRDELIAKFVKAYGTAANKSTEEQATLASELAGNEFDIIVRTAATSKAAASAPAFVTVKMAPAIAATLTAEEKLEAGKVAVTAEAEKSYMTFEFKDGALTLKPAGTFVFEIATDGKGEKWTKISKETTIAAAKMKDVKKVLVRTAGAKEDTKKQIVGNWASNIDELAVPTATPTPTPTNTPAPTTTPGT